MTSEKYECYKDGQGACPWRQGEAKAGQFLELDWLLGVIGKELQNRRHYLTKQLQASMATAP